MNKLTLDCDALSVESFPTLDEETDALGTVRGHDSLETNKIVCNVTTLTTNPTCCPCTP